MTGPGAEGGRIVRVVPDVPAVHRRFDYTVPPALDAEVVVGSRVRVDLHGRRVAGWVVEVDVPPTPGITPRPLARSSGAGPPAAVVDLAGWAAWRWDGPLVSFLGTASPPRNVPLTAVAARHEPEGDGSAPDGSRSGGSRVEVPSPGGGAVALADQLEGAGRERSVVRLAPSLDAALVVRELVHRRGPAGMLVLTPSTAGARALAVRLRQAGVPVDHLPEDWAAVARGRAAVAVGTRAGAWAPMAKVRTAVVVDAHDEAYREERTPTWSAVDVVAERCRRDGGNLVLVTPCPTLSLLEGCHLATTDRATERRGWAVVESVDRTADDPRTGLYSERLVRAVRDELARPGGRVVCVLNRTGRVRVLACAACGSLCRCTTCGAAVRMGEDADVLVCPRCGEHRPPLCAVCDARRLRALRVGVRRAAEELSTLVGAPAWELAGRDPGGTVVVGEARGSGEAGEPARRDDGPVRHPLVVGTEAALHRVDEAGVVAFLDFDQHLLAHRFGAAEEALALVARASRLVGGRTRAGRVLLQTRIPTHPVVVAATGADPGVVTDVERPVRQALGLPPFGAMAVCSGPGGAAHAAALGGRTGISVSEAADGRWLVRAVDHRTLCDALAATARPAERVRVEVDPTDV